MEMATVKKKSPDLPPPEKRNTNGQSGRLVQLHMILIIRGAGAGCSLPTPSQPLGLGAETPHTVGSRRHGEDDLIRSAD